MTHDYWFQLEHRRIREKYSWEAIMRHEQWIMRALRSRREKYWSEIDALQPLTECTYNDNITSLNSKNN